MPPCNPNVGSITIDLADDDFLRFRVKADSGGGLPKFAVAARDPEGSDLVILHDGSPKPFTADWPRRHDALFIGRYSVGFRALYETCRKYDLRVTVHRRGSERGTVLKDCKWSAEGDPPPFTTLRVQVRSSEVT